MMGKPWAGRDRREDKGRYKKTLIWMGKGKFEDVEFHNVTEKITLGNKDYDIILFHPNLNKIQKKVLPIEPLQ